MPTAGDDENPAPLDDLEHGQDHGVAPSAEESTFAEQMAAAEDARRLLWPWVARRTRSQVIALVLISCLALGPAFALVSILRSDPTPVNTLIEAPPTGPEVTRITVTATRITPTVGEMQVRVSLDPSADLLDASGRLARTLSVAFNDVQGTSSRTFAAGEAASSFEIDLPLTEGNTSRYPFDSYRGSAVIVVTAENGDEREPIPSVVSARSVINDFTVSGMPGVEADSAGQALTVVDMEATRPATTTVYAIWLMILMWGLAVVGLFIVWAVVIWMVDLPFWAVGYLVGVLFALPQLRDSLPGRPPPGTIFDFGSFYWSVTLVGVNLILLLIVWLRRVRSQSRLRSIDTTREA